VFTYRVHKLDLLKASTDKGVHRLELLRWALWTLWTL